MVTERLRWLYQRGRRSAVCLIMVAVRQHCLVVEQKHLEKALCYLT
jgi:hypothetical protein